MIKAVLFDLDGTLIDSTEAIVDCFYHTFDVLGAPLPERQQIVSTISLTLEHQFSLLIDHDPYECARIYREKYFRVAPEMTLLHGGAQTILERCGRRGYQMGFVTSKLRQASELLLNHLGVLHHFSVRIGPDDVDQPKPHPEPILKALDLLALRPVDAIYLGDTPLDVRASQAAGVRCVALTTGYASEAELAAHNPDAICANLEEAWQWIQREAAGSR